MRTAVFSLVLFLAVAGASWSQWEASTQEVPACPEKTMYDDESDSCLPVVDQREAFAKLHMKSKQPPSLALQRVQHHGTTSPSLSRGKSSMPVPGGIGAGTVYRQGQLPATSDTYLQTFMGIYPTGLGNTANWIYTTATNRTEKGTEVLGAYLGSTAHLKVWDWSCSVAAPCPLNLENPNAPGWVSTVSLWDLYSDGCHMTIVEDAGGHQRPSLRYRNRTWYDANYWNENWVYLKNYCNGSWEAIYAHGYSGQQINCSLYPSTCGWWGPIVETFGDTPAIVPELTFVNARLYRSGTLYYLTNQYTYFVEPSAPWVRFDLTPNYSWGIGGRLP